MWSPGYTPEPIEKIRKPQWTVENTVKTQIVVNRLNDTRRAIIAVSGHNSEAVHAIQAALRRFHELGSQLVIPFLD